MKVKPHLARENNMKNDNEKPKQSSSAAVDVRFEAPSNDGLKGEFVSGHWLDRIETRFPGLGEKLEEYSQPGSATVPTAGSVTLVFSDGLDGPVVADSTPVSGELIGKDDWQARIHPMVLDFLKTPSDPSIYRPDIEGQLVNDEDPYKLISTRAIELKVTLDGWLELKGKSAAGVDPVLGDFLRANPDYFDPNRAEGDGITLRQLGALSDNLKSLNRDKPIIQQGSEWVAPKLVLHNYLGEKIMNELIDFAKAKGLNVKTGLGRHQQIDVYNSPKP